MPVNYTAALSVGVVVLNKEGFELVQLMRPPLEMVTEMLGILLMLVRMVLELHGEITAERPTHGVITETWVGNSS